MATLDVYVVSAARTPLGAFQGSLTSLSAPELGAIAIQGAIKRAGIEQNLVEEVIFGNVLTSGVGQAPARQASIRAGLPQSIPAITINKVCGSGMKAVMLAAQSIANQESGVVVAGGQESMTNAPFLMPQARAGFRMGNATVVDSMIHDGLWDPYNNQHMGNCGELCAKEYGFTREAQDAFAVQSFERAIAAQKSGAFQEEIEAVEIKSAKGDLSRVDADEGPSKVKFDKIPLLKPAFDRAGTITAANASTINDGAAALVLAGSASVTRLGFKPIAKIVASATHAQDPVWFTTAPGPAMKKALERAGWKASDVDLYEVNEAFAVVAMAAMKDVGIPREKINVNGGAISLGHPIGASGARIIVTLIHALRTRGLKRGLAGICIGGGEATAVAVELV